jgi:hypothetical protein
MNEKYYTIFLESVYDGSEWHMHKFHDTRGSIKGVLESCEDVFKWYDYYRENRDKVKIYTMGYSHCLMNVQTYDEFIKENEEI